MDDLHATLRLEGEAVKSGNLRDYRTLGTLMISAAARIEELEAERDALKAAKWDVLHTDTMNEIVQMGMARDEANARIKELEAELAKTREWNCQMVEKAASGGVLDGYRELGQRAAIAEARADTLAAMLKEAAEVACQIEIDRGDKNGMPSYAAGARACRDAFLARIAAQEGKE